ncbi:putative polysaccharide synthase Cps1 [Metarhizium anisopliae]
METHFGNLPMRLCGVIVPSLLSFDFLNSTTFWAYLFWILWLHRYVRLLVHCLSHWTYKSKPLPANPKYTNQDVTVVVPTIHDNPEELKPSLRSLLACNPACLYLVTPYDKFEALKRAAEQLGVENVQVLSNTIANKRRQLCEAIPSIETPITVLADDDVTWPSKMLTYLLAPFEDDKMGGVGSCQRVKRVWYEPWSTRIWNWLGAAYIERRNFEITATHNIDGGTSCMSGRTVAYRTEILKGHDFLSEFQNEKWGEGTLNTDDDNFITRWLVKNRWKTWIQYDPECELETTLENSMELFVLQCIRWARSNWRSNWTSLFIEGHVWKQQMWCTYALHIATFTSLAFLVDPLLLLSCWQATADWDTAQRERAFWAQFIFMFGFTKVVKLVGLFKRNPSDIVFLPVSIIFGYFHGLIKIYALLTLRTTTWGSRPDGDTNNDSRLQPLPRPSEYVASPKTKEHSDLTASSASGISDGFKIRQKVWGFLTRNQPEDLGKI